MGLNSANILLSISKIIMIFVEINSNATNIFQMSTEVGQLNLDIELYPDVIKIGTLGLLYFVFPALPIVAASL